MLLMQSIRRSENAADQSFDESMPYTCTMRNWKPMEPEHGQRGTSQMMGRETVKDGCHGPELLLCPVDMTRSNSVPNQYPGDSTSPPNNARFQSLYDSRLRERRNTSDGSLGATSAQHDENGSETSGSGKQSHKRIRSLIPPSNRTSAAANAAFGRLESGTSTRTFSIVNSDPGQNSTNSPRCQSPPPPTSYVIPLSDILVVDADNRTNESAPANNGTTEELSSSMTSTITTISHGFFEFCFESRNAQIVFQAFLQASLPQERLALSMSTRNLMAKVENNEPQNNARGTKPQESEVDSYNMDNFTAKELSERVRTESQYDKMKRRMSRFSWKVKEIAGNFVDGEFCACTCLTSNANDKKEGKFHFSNLDLLAPSRTDTSASETEEDKFYMDEPATPNAANRGISYRISYEETPMKSASYMTDVTDTTPISEYNESLHFDLMMPSSLETPIMTPNRELNTRLFDAEPMPTFQTPPPKQMSQYSL
eukprot:scaffold44458_cov52-Attheya_sp.AAC.2